MGECVADPTRTAFSIHALICNFVAADSKSEPRHVVWTKPLRNTYKLNVDAAFSENGTGGAGVVLRNDRGEAIVGACWPLHNIFDATMAEATALQKGLSLIEGLQCVLVTVESDSLELVEAFNENNSSMVSICSDTCGLLSNRLQDWINIGASLHKGGKLCGAQLS